MNYEKFQRRFQEGIYKPGDKFWVCDVRENEDYPVGDFRRKLKPTHVVALTKENHEIYFVRAKKDGNPSKTLVSIMGPTLYAKPFHIFETEYEAKEYYQSQLKDVFMKINTQYDSFKATCSVVLGGILKELQENQLT